MIECKAVKLSQAVLNQVIGYNYYMKACFVAVANQEHIRTGWYDTATEKYKFVDTLPSYQELLKTVMATA